MIEQPKKRVELWCSGSVSSFCFKRVICADNQLNFDDICKILLCHNR